MRFSKEGRRAICSRIYGGISTNHNDRVVCYVAFDSVESSLNEYTVH